MEITKPSQLREGMKLKGKWDGIPVSGYAAEGDGGWYLMPAALDITVGGEGDSYFTDLESVEGIRAAKEGDVLVNKYDDDATILFVNDRCVILSTFDSPDTTNGSLYTWEELEKSGWKLKGGSVTMADIASAYQEINIREIQQAVFKEIEEELFKHKFSADMSGWQIVPQLTATMQILRSKYFGEDQRA